MASAAILRAARARISDPSKWTQGAFARDAEGLEREPASKWAVCWCALGSLEVEFPFGGGFMERTALRRAVAVVAPGLPQLSVEQVNDRFDHATILAVFDEAIADVEARF